MPLPSRVVDYFVVLRVAQTKIESGGRFKQIGLPLIKALRYPLCDFKDAEFPSDLGCFAFPDGARFEAILPSIQKYSFVLTEGDGGRIYCQALRFWREINSKDLGIYNELYDVPNNIRFEPFIIIIVSHWGFLREFEVILSRLFEVTSSSSHMSLPYPIEECLTNLIYETPLPPRGRRIVEFNCYNEVIYFIRAPPNEHFYNNDEYMNILFHTLSLNNILSVVIAMLCEKRLLLYSASIELLTPCSESLCSLIFPFYWQHIYVPVLPSKFTDFVYAPMPFICGVLRSYLPDLSLLEGVVFVDLDCNVVKFHSSDPIPKFSPISNNREINKLVSNPKKPFNQHIKMDSRDVTHAGNAFIKFFAKLLKSYKICMNPSTGPSKDRFNKEKWINYVLNEKESDKERDETFLNLFVEAQLFECFIDERFDASANINNYEVLYFDEKIDEIIHNKSTPFLLDTTFLHQKSDNYKVPTPPHHETKLYYKAFPFVFDDKVCVIHNIAPVLVTEQDLNEQQSMHISWMSVEFFKQKRLYDRHFHSLESRVNSQNILFRQILQFFMKWSDANNKYISDLEMINACVNSISDKNHQNDHQTSLHLPWFKFKKYISNYCDSYKSGFNESKKKSFIPIMESVGSKENELSVIIQTARKCESMTAKTKCEVEFANKNLLKYSKRLKDKESQLKESQLTLKLDEFISAVENKDKYEIEHVESTTTFLTNLEIFTTSMPTMIDDVKKISKQRLTNFKQYLHHFISSNRIMHQRFADELQQIQDMIEAIDPQQDIEKFVEGKYADADAAAAVPSAPPSPPLLLKSKSEDRDRDRAPIAAATQRRYSISRELSQLGMTRLKHNHLSIANIQNHLKQKQRSREKDRRLIKTDIITDDHGIDRVNGSILYSDNLWGNKEFQMVLRQCEDGKNVIKTMVRAMEDLSDIWDLQSKSLMRCTQSMKLNLNLSGKEKEIWRSLYTLTERCSQLYKSGVGQVKNVIFELKIMKGELKSISKLLQRKKGELGSEVQFATRNVQLAYDERNACLRIYRQTQSQWKQLTNTTTTWSEHELKPLLDQMASAQLNFKQSDMKWNRSKNILRSVKQKEDLCNGVILDTFREKEINRQSCIILSISHLVSILFELIYGIDAELKKFMSLCLSLNVEQEIDSFIDKEITSSAAMLDRENIRWTAKSVELSWISSKNAIDSAKAMLDFFLCRVSAAEQYSRNFSRRSAADWNSSTSNFCINKFGYSLNDLFLNFNKFIHDLSSISLDFLFAVKYCIEALLNEVKKCMEQQNVSSHQLIAECNTDFNKLEEKLAKSVIECRRLETQIDALKQRISEKENKNKSEKKRTFKIFEKSKEQLQTELSSTQNKLKQEISNRDRLKAQLQQKSKYRDVLFSKVITDFVRHEEYRLKMNKYIYCIYSKINEECLMRMHALTVELKNNVETINIKNNIQKFVLQNRSSHNVPKIVLDHAIFKISQEKNAIFEKTIRDVKHILSPYTRCKYKSIFNTNSNQLLDLNSDLYHDINQNNDIDISYHNDVGQGPLNITLYISTDAHTITLPKLKQVSSNQEISKHLLAYVTKHSMKGGKHARIDSLHSISRSHKKKIFQNVKKSQIDAIDEEKEKGKINDAQQMQQSLYASGFSAPTRKRKK